MSRKAMEIQKKANQDIEEFRREGRKKWLHTIQDRIASAAGRAYKYIRGHMEPGQATDIIHTRDTTRESWAD